MPDTSLITGINDTNILGAQQDTAASANDVFKNNPQQFNNPNDIVQPEAPKGLYGTVNPGENINIDKTSYEYNARLADSLGRQGNEKLPDILLPQSETKRFTGNDYGFDIGRNNESFYEQHQNGWKMLANAGANLVAKTAAYAAQNLGFVLGAPVAAATGNISNMTDNFLTKAGDWLKDGVENNFPIYKSDKYTEGNIWQKLGTLGWWADDAVDRLGLTAAMFIPGMAEAKGIGLFGTVADEMGGLKAVGIGAKAIQSLAENPENYGWIGKKFISNLYKAATDGVLDQGVNPALKSYAKSLSNAELYTWNILGQSALNAKETQEAVMKATGDKDKAASAGMKSFWETVPLSLAGSLVEIPQMFSTTNTTKSIINKVFNPETGEVLEDAFRIKSPGIAKTALKAALTGLEHGQNESMQVAVSRYNEESAEGKDKRGTIPGIFGDFLDNIHDPNGQNNIALGTIQGILMTLGGKAYKNWKGEDAQEAAQQQSLFNIINQAKLARRYYNEDFVERDENGKVVLDSQGNPIKDQKKLADAGMSLAGLDTTLALKKDAIQNKRYVEADLIDHKALAGFAYNFLSDPNGINHLTNILKLEAKSNSENPDRINDVDENGAEITPEVQLQRNLQRVNSFKKIYDAIDQRHAGFTNLEYDRKDKGEVRKAAEFIDDLKHAQYAEAVNQSFLQEQINKNERQAASLEDSIGEITGEHPNRYIKNPSNPMEERFNDLNEQTQALTPILEDSKERYKKLVDKKAQREAFNQQKEFDRVVEQEAKKQQEAQKEQKKEPEINPNDTTPAQVQTPEQTQPTTQPIEPTKETKPTTEPIEKQKKAQALFNQKNEDLSKATTPEEKSEINKKYIKDVITLGKEPEAGEVPKTPEEQEQRYNEIKETIPDGNTIDVNEHDKIFNLINDEAKKGNIDPLHENFLISQLDTKSVIGTIFDSKELEDQSSDKDKPQEPKQDTTEQDVKDQTEKTTDENPEIGNIDQDFNPDTNDKEDPDEDAGTLSFIAFRTSNKTITQEEKTDENGNYTNQLDEDRYKQFKQGYFRHVNEQGFPENGIPAKIIKDSDELPHSEETKRAIESGVPYGSVLVLTDGDRNMLYFDENYNSSAENKEGSKPIVYSFNNVAWKNDEAFRAIVGENRTGISADLFIEMYERERQQQALARELNNQGKEVYVDIKGISPGTMNKLKNEIPSLTAVSSDMNPVLYIPPSPVDRFDPENPLKNKYVTVGNQSLVNGALYAQVTDQKSNITSYVRLLPNRISDMPELQNNILELLDHQYNDENEANIAADYINEILFLGRSKRPTTTVRQLDNNKFNVRIIQNGITLEGEVFGDFMNYQRLNIPRTSIESNEYQNLTIENGSLKSQLLPDYTTYILKNSTTKSVPIKTSEGSKFLALNSYAMFDFLDSLESMGRNMSKEESTPPGERPMNFDLNREIPVFRHGANDEENTGKNSGTNNIPLNEEGREQARILGERLKNLGIQTLYTSKILRAIETARIAADVAGIKTMQSLGVLDTWDKGEFTSKSDSLFDEAYFVLNPDAIEKDGIKLGETFNTYRKRMQEFMKTFSTVAGTPAIIAHSSNIRLWDAIKENNGLWNDNAAERYLNLPSNFAFTSIIRSEIKSDNSSLTKSPLRRLGTIKSEETEVQRLAREQDERDKGLKAKVDIRENRGLLKESEIQKVNENFGYEIAKRVNDIVNSDARALWTTSGIKLYRDARQGDAYHEAWHHFSQLYLSMPEKSRLYNEVRKRAINFTDREGNKLNTKEATDLQIEEFVADDFRDYAEKDGKSILTERPARNSIFRKILDFIKKFFFGNIDFNKLYNDLYTGNLNTYEPSINNAMWGKLNSRAVNQKGDEIISNQKAAYYRGVVDYFMGDQLLKAKTSVGQLRKNTKLTEAIYKNIYNDLVTKYYNPLLDKSDAGEEIDQETAEDLYKILSNWEDFVQYHKQDSKLFLNIEHEIAVDVPEDPEDYTEKVDTGAENVELKELEEEVTGETPEEREAEYSDKLYDRAGNEQSSMEAASIETKSLIRMLPEVSFKDGKFNMVIDNKGFPKLNDYAKTWNNLAFNLANLSKYPEMIEKMNDPEVKAKIPELSVLLQHLPDPAKEHTPAEMKMITAFRTDFNRAYIGIYSGRIYGSGDNMSYFFNEETKRNKDKIVKLWTANFYNKLNSDPNVTSSNILVDEENGKYYLNPSKALNYNIVTVKGREDLLNLLGFSFSDNSKKQVFYKTSLSQLLKSIQDNINTRNQSGQKIYNPIYDLRSDVRDNTGQILIPGLRKTLDGLLYFESKFSTDVPSLSYQTPDGEMIHGLSLNHTLSIISNLLNKAKSYQDIINEPALQHLNYHNNPYARGSIFLNSLFDLTTGKRKPNTLVVGNYYGLKSEDRNGNTVGYSTTSLNVRQKIVFDINSLLTSGAIEIMRTESSKSAYFIKLERYFANQSDPSSKYLPVGINEFTTSFNSPNFKSIMIDNYLYDELYRMQNAKNVDVYKKSPNLMEAAEGFDLFRDILNKIADKNTESLKNALKESIQKSTVQETIQKYRPSIDKAIENYFNTELKSFKEGLAEENIGLSDMSKDIPGTSLDQKYRAFIANDFILNIEYAKLFNGDTIYRADYKDYFKRSKGDISTGKAPITDDLFARAMRATENNTFAGFIGSKIKNDYKTTRTVNFNDDERASKYIEIYKKDLKAVNPGLGEAKLNELLDKYKKLNIGDGQGWITMDFYRQFLKSINNWSDNQEMMYKVELAKWRLAHANFNTNYTNEMKETDREFLKSNPQTFSYFPPLKIQYNGPIQAKGTYAPVMDKFSVAPLIPSVIQGTPLEEIHNEMLKNGIGYSKFMSGTKKYKAPGYNLYDENGFKGIDLSNHESQVHYLEYLKEQINTNPKIKTESIFGSQVRKLIEANIFSNGIATKEDLERHERYKSYIKGIVDLGKKELYKELSLEEKDGKLLINDIKQFISTLQDQAEARELNDNILDYIQYDKYTDKMMFPLETSLNRGPIQDMIMGIIDRRLRIQKLSGDQLIQISSSGFQPNDFKYTNATEDEIKKYGTNGLRFYHLQYDKDGKPTRTVAAQVKVGLNGSFEGLLNKVHSDGKRIGTIERLNELLKDDDWMEKNRKSVTLVGYRIPTQGHNSIEYLEVAEFLPPHVGSSVIVPAEIVAKAGSDFDIDKLSIFRPSFDKNGEIVNDESKEGYANKIIDLFSEILSDPKTFEKLITPNDTNLIKGEVNKIAVAIGKRTNKDAEKPRPYSGTQIYRYRTNVRKFETLLSAKRLLSIFAVNNTFTTLMQQAGITMNTIYGLQGGVIRPVKMLLLSDKEKAKVLKDGRINLGDKYDVEGNLKQDVLNQYINATVDAASDDFFGYINMSYENVNVLCNLINQGVPKDRAMWFLNQPVLLRYYSDLRGKSIYEYKSDVQARILGALTDTNFYYTDEEGKTKLDRKAFNSKINEILNSPLASKMFLSKQVLEKTTKKTSEVNDFLADPRAKTYNALVFSYFLSLQEQAQLFRNFQTLLNFDTTKTRSPLSAWQAWRGIADLKANRMFDEKEVAKMLDKSVISPFDNRRLIATIGAKLMPVAFNPFFMEQINRDITKATQFKTRNVQKKIISNYENQWIEYTVKSMSKIDQYSLQSYSKYLLEGRNNLARKFNDLISKYPELREDYALVNRIRPNFPNKPDIKKSNLEIYRLFENSTDDQNRYISEFRELINLDNPRKYDPIQAKEIRDFFKDMAILGFVQSGFSRSNISFQELIPYEQLADIFKTAIQNLNRYILSDKALMKQYVQEFSQQFGNNNGENAVQKWRGRDYYLNEKIAQEVAKKSGRINIIKYQVNTQTQPAPYENTVKPTVPQKATEVQKADIIDAQQDLLLQPEQKTQRQYWPGDEVSDNADELTQVLGKAQFKYSMDRLSEVTPYFLDLPDNMTKEQVDKMFDDYETEQYDKKITPENFEKMLRLHAKHGDNILTTVDGDESSLKDIKDNLNRVELFNETGTITFSTEFDNLKDLFDEYRKGDLDKQYIEYAEKILSDYGLLRYKDFNPDQLIIPFEGVDQETYNKQINQILKDKDNGC